MNARFGQAWSIGLAAVLIAGCAGVQRHDENMVHQVRLSIVEAMAERGDWTAAFHAADALTRENPSSARAWLLRGRALRHRNMMVEAESDLRHVLELEPKSAAAHAELGIVCEHVGRLQEALEHHREAHRLAPGDPRYLNNLGFALTLRGKAREAVPLLEQALRIEPANARLRNNLGFAYAATGDFARSAQQFQLAGAPAQAKNNLGLAYELNGNLPHAYELYLEAWRIAPAPSIRDNLLHVARKLGRDVPPEITAPTSASEKGGS
jgi:Flp pilus assembly protein TadD